MILVGRCDRREPGGVSQRPRIHPNHSLDISGQIRILKYMLKHVGELDLVFQALGDPTRRELVDRLTRGPASVSELAAPLPISLPAVHQHLRVLEDCGLIRSEKIGRVRTCHLELKMLNSAQTW